MNTAVAAEAARAAAAYVEAHGLHKGHLVDCKPVGSVTCDVAVKRGIRVCLIGALIGQFDEYDNMTVVVWDALSDWCRQTHGDIPSRWNDRDETTVADAAALLRAFADAQQDGEPA